MARKTRIFKTLLRIANSQSGDDCFGTIIDTSHNWFEDNSGGRTGDGDPNLGFLRNNGGPTHTHALLVDSGAIDKGDDAVCAAAPVYNLDQCGIARLIGDHCDIGAYAYKDDSNFFCTTRKNGTVVVIPL